MVPSIQLMMLVLIGFSVIAHGRSLQGDDMCPNMTAVLCVQDVLLTIVKMTKDVAPQLNEIENGIMNNARILDTLNRSTNDALDRIHSQLPKSQYHMRFPLVYNIDQVRSLVSLTFIHIDLFLAISRSLIR